MSTHSNVEDIQSLETYEAILAQYRPFGDSEYINGQLQVCYKRRLNKISDYLPVASELLCVLDQASAYNQYRVIGDTIVRCAIQHALAQLKTGMQYGLPLDQCEEIFRETIRHLEKGNCNGGPLVSGLNRLGPEPYHGWIWSEVHSDDVFGRSFRYVIQHNYGSELCTPDAHELAQLSRGAKLLGELLPLLSRSALRHAYVIAVVPEAGHWIGKASSSQYRVSGTIFLNRELLQNPWWVADHLFHESLHQKLYDFRHGHSVLKEDSSPEPNSPREDLPKVCSIWNLPGANKLNCWDTHRAVAAFHVYVHLALLARLAEQRSTELEKVYGGLHDFPFTMTKSRKAFERAHYLGENIKKVCWQELGLAGQLLIDWLILILDAIDPSPPPQDPSYIHLLLDRYLIEAKRLEKAVSTNLKAQLGKLIRDEVKSTRSVLSTVNARGDLNRFNNALEQYADEELGTKFSEVRTLIAKTLVDVSPDGYRMRCSSPEATAPDEIVKRMVERSSEQLVALGAVG
jgi:hypothetical protein